MSRLADTLKSRRERLSELIDFPVLLKSGEFKPRNFPANTYPFRASSHFLYFAGLSLPNAAVRIEGDRLILFLDDPKPSSALWHGESPSRDQLAAEIGADEAYPLSEIERFSVEDHPTVIEAIVKLRLIHDESAIAEIRRAIAVTVEAHRAGMQATLKAQRESQIRAAMESVILSHNMTCAYNSIVTVNGEVLHNDHYHHAIEPTDLILADVGAETESGWASDITRTWSASGKFSPTQRALYDIVLEAHDRAIDKIRPGVEYRDIHLLACETLAEGLIDLGILRGNAADLVDRDAHALFFPHGIGHLLGLDVHDMEDLGDLAGYEKGRSRSSRFGLGYLRLDRPLQAGMIVTIEPGFYQVPALLNDPERREKYHEVVNWERLAEFSDVRGIRIEDDVLVTSEGSEVLSIALPTDPEQVEMIVGEGA
ncbi:aminopeptidase P family protein [Leptolyngbya sp. NIES-2104]|uniref:aminopeptidase P family protein n=1 Tax=Leptolyngbya sp. NIES-2104 TaxID=1552121 RepID=UPI0006EC67AE|nr:aminopeptidase P family protein [Leptolyngbya sp. NIES-2104]GAP99443.1 Xaa-Pro aminopeptidase [Leptolyngbya sp. NIES-2104]